MSNTQQPEALRLADILQHKLPSIECLEVAATELRRLQAENDALLERCDELGSDKETYFRLYNSACIELQEIKKNVLPSLQQDANRFRFANDSEEDFAICYWDELMGNGGEWMCNGRKGNSIDLLDAAIAALAKANGGAV